MIELFVRVLIVLMIFFSGFSIDYVVSKLLQGILAILLTDLLYLLELDCVIVASVELTRFHTIILSSIAALSLVAMFFSRIIYLHLLHATSLSAPLLIGLLL